VQKRYLYGAAVAAISALCLGIGLTASSKEKTAGDGNVRPPAEQVNEAAAGNRAMQSMRVYRNPETGQLGRAPGGTFTLSPEERRMLSRSTEGLTSRVLPNGAVALDLQGRFMNLSIATRNADGTISMNCVHDLYQAEMHLHQQTPATRPGREEVRDVR